MSVIESGKEVIDRITQLSKEEYAIGKISRFLRLVATIILISVWINDRMNIGIPFNKMDLNLWNKDIRFLIDSHYYFIVIFWIVYKIIISNFFRALCIKFDRSEGVKSLPVLFTLDDFVDFGCSLFFCIFAFNQIIERNNNIVGGDETINILAGMYLLGIFINWLYRKNSNNWYYIRREYTDFYDINNKRIPKDAYVIYYGKRYRLIWSGDIVGVKQEEQRKEWILSSWDDKKGILLEEAAKNREGNLTIDTWKIGEKI